MMTKREFLKYEIEQILVESNLNPEQFFLRKNYLYNVVNLLDSDESQESDFFKIDFFKKKYYVFFTDKKEKVENGEFHIERILVQNSIEINDDFYSEKGEKERSLYSNFIKDKTFNDYTLDELKERFLKITHNQIEKYFSVIITNDQNLLNDSSYAINIDELLKICKSFYNPNNIRFDLNNFPTGNWEVLRYFIKILNENILSANQKFINEFIELKDYDEFGRDYSDSFVTYIGWEENRNFEFFKIHTFLQNTKFDKNGFLSLHTEKEETILYFFKYLKYEMFPIFSDVKEWENSAKGLKYYDGFRIYIKNEEEFRSLFLGTTFRKFDIDVKIDHNYYIEFFIKPLDYWIQKIDYNELNKYCKDNNFLRYILF